MKLTIPASEVTTAITQYLQRTYSMYGEVTMQVLEEVEVDIKPREFETVQTFTEVLVDEEDIEEDTTREDAIKRADYLGIKYRADISTEKLIERIEEHEEEVLRLATEEIQNFPEEDLFSNELESVPQSEEPLEDKSDEEVQEIEEEEPQKKKKSIFDKS